MDGVLLGGVDAGLAAMLFGVPAILGGRLALGQLVLVALSIWVAVCWCLRQCLLPRAAWIRSPAVPLSLLALALVGLQLAPLSPSLIERLSPRLYETLPLWKAGADSPAALGEWNKLSLTPIETRNGFILLLAFVLLLLTVLQRVRQLEDMERLLRWVAASAVAAALFGLIQYFTSNGKYFWFFRHPFSGTDEALVGSFSNKNHFAHFVVLGTGPLLWWIHRELLQGGGHSSGRRWFRGNARGREIRVGLLALALAVSVFAVLMSLSRGGALALLAAATVCLTILYRGALIGKRTVLAVAGAGLLVGISLVIHGYENVARRADDLVDAVKDFDSDGRTQLWRADARVVADFPLTGTGLGSHGEICPTYYHNMMNGYGYEYTHAENGYLQLAMETGLPGLLLALAAVGLCITWCLPAWRRDLNPRRRLCYAAVAAGLAASFVHAAVDFVWYVPGLMVVVVILAVCACRLWQQERGQDGRSPGKLWIPRAVWMAAAAQIVFIGTLMVKDRFRAVRAEPFWHRCLALGRDLADPAAAELPEKLKSMQANLSAVLNWQPDLARAHAWLAEVHLTLFDLPEAPGVAPITVKQVSDTVAQDPQLQSPEVLGEWLARAFPQRRRHLDTARYHARRAVTLCPLLGENYVFLADLAFLTGLDSGNKSAYLEQAFKVRPFDGPILFAAGQEAALAGNFDEAVRLWQHAAQTDPVYQLRLAKQLIPLLPVDALLAIVRPDRTRARRLRQQYAELGREQDLPAVDAYLARACELEAPSMRGTEAAECWLDAALAHRRLDNTAEALRCLRHAVDSDWTCQGARRQLGTLLLKLRQFDEAEEHLRWCVQQSSDDERLRAHLEAAIDGRLRTRKTAAGRTRVDIW